MRSGREIFLAERRRLLRQELAMRLSKAGRGKKLSHEKELSLEVEVILKESERLMHFFKEMTRDFENEAAHQKSSKLQKMRDKYAAYSGVSVQLLFTIITLLHLEMVAHRKGERKLELKVSKAIGSELNAWVKERERSKNDWKEQMR